MKMIQSRTKAFMENMIWVLRNYKQMGNLAIVARSKILKELVPINNFFFERIQKRYEERYFDISQIHKAIEFISRKEKNG